MKLVKEAGLMSRFRGQDILHLEKLDYDLRKNVVDYMRGKGYLEARTGEPRVEGLGPKRTGFPILPLPIISSTDEGLRVTIPVTEGKLYRLGEIKIEGNSIYSEELIRQVIGLRAGRGRQRLAHRQGRLRGFEEPLRPLGLHPVRARHHARVQAQPAEARRGHRRLHHHHQRGQAVHAPPPGVPRQHLHARQRSAPRGGGQRGRHLRPAVVGVLGPQAQPARLLRPHRQGEGRGAAARRGEGRGRYQPARLGARPQPDRV